MPRRRRFFDDPLRESSRQRLRVLRKLGPYPVRYYDAMKRMGITRRIGFKLLDKELAGYVKIWRDDDAVWVQRTCRRGTRQ
jgi:hypothetical protein